MIKLVCTSPFQGFHKGQEVTDPFFVERLLRTHDRHFVKVASASQEQPMSETPAPEPEQKQTA